MKPKTGFKAGARVLALLGCVLLLIAVGTRDVQAVPTDTLFGIAVGSNPGDPDELMVIDPVTGGLSLVGTIAGAAGASSASTFDAANHRYFFQDSNRRLYSVDTGTAAVLGNPVLSRVVPNFEFDPGTGTLFGVAVGSNPGDPDELMVIDPITGALTLVGTIAGASGASSASTFDAANHRYFFQDSNRRLYSVDTGTAAVLGNPVLSRVVPNFEFQAASPVPEPATMLLLGSGLAGVGALARRWRRGSQ